MTKNVLASVFAAARGLLRHWRALAVLVALYAALIAAVFFFITTREATAWQVFVTGLTAFVAPLLFFVVQAAGASYAVGHTRPSELLRRTARSFLKVLALGLPLVALVVLSVYLLNKLENKVQLTPEERNRERIEAQASVPDEESAETTTSDSSDTSETAKPKPPVRWGYLSVSALRLLVLGVFLPLVAIHLWLAAARDGLSAAFKRSPRLVARAFSARSVLTYGVGMIVFALIPYFLITKRTPVASNWLEISIFGVRILVAFSLMLFGWVMTMTALARDGEPPTSEPSLDEAHVPAAPAATATAG